MDWDERATPHNSHAHAHEPAPAAALASSLRMHTLAQTAWWSLRVVLAVWSLCARLVLHSFAICGSHLVRFACSLRLLQRALAHLRWTAIHWSLAWRRLPDRCRRRRHQEDQNGVTLATTRLNPRTIAVRGVYMLPLRGYTPMRYLRSPAVADPTDSTPRSQVDHARQHTTEVDPVRAASFTRPLYDGASSPSEVSFLERLMNHSDHGGVDSQSGSVSAQHPQPAFSLVSPIMRLYVPHALERYRPRRRRRGRIDPFSLVRGVAAWMRAQHGFFSFRLGEAAELDAQGVTVDDRFDRVHFYYSMIDMCRCIHCAIEAGFKPRRIFHFARSVHLGPREEAELFYFMPITLREVGLLCSDRLIRNGSVLYSNLSLALDDCASFQQPCDSFSATTEVLVCRVSLQPGRTFILAAHDLQPRHYTHSLSLAHPHAVLVFDTACVLPMWFLTVDESAVYGGTPVAQMTRDAAPDGTVTPATPTTTVRQLNVKAVAMQLAIQLRTPNATRPNTETLARAPNAMRRA